MKILTVFEAAVSAQTFVFTEQAILDEVAHEIEINGSAVVAVVLRTQNVYVRCLLVQFPCDARKC
jgi:hypothetical protein